MTDRPQIKSHTGLRGIAALLVVAYHLQFGVWYHLDIEEATSFFKRCYLLVDLFFILSGFIISYVSDFTRPGKDILIRDFVVRRLIRLYPLLLFTLLYFVTASFIMAFLTVDPWRQINLSFSLESLLVLLSQLLMINAWLPLPIGWNVPSWSISAELVAYALFPWMAQLYRSFSVKTLLLLIAIPLIFYGWLASSGRTLDIVSVLAPARCLAGFSIGIVIYLFRNRLRNLSVAQTNVIQVTGVLSALVILTWSFNDVLAIPAFAMVVASTCNGRGVVAEILATRPAIYLGTISYSIYLNHVCLIMILRLVWDKFIPPIGIRLDVERLLWLTTSLTVVLLFSSATYHFVEVRARAYLMRRWFGQRVTSMVTSPPAP